MSTTSFLLANVGSAHKSVIKDAVLATCCPCCKDKVETSREHFLQCASNSQHLTNLGNLKSAINNSNIHPVCYLLLHGMCHWLPHDNALPFKPSHDEFPPHFSPYLQNALKSQQTVGWDKAVKGFYSKRWHIIASMDMYQSGRNDPTKGVDRMRSIISCRSQLLDIVCHTAHSERRLTSEG